jgi:hypothetical protein
MVNAIHYEGQLGLTPLSYTSQRFPRLPIRQNLFVQLLCDWEYDKAVFSIPGDTLAVLFLQINKTVSEFLSKRRYGAIVLKLGGLWHY